MSEPNFSFLSLPEFLLVDVEKRIASLETGLKQRDPTMLMPPLQLLEKIRGNFAFDLISSIAWAAKAVCRKAADEKRPLSSLEAKSLAHAFNSMDRARLTALISAGLGDEHRESKHEDQRRDQTPERLLRNAAENRAA